MHLSIKIKCMKLRNIVTLLVIGSCLASCQRTVIVSFSDTEVPSPVPYSSAELVQSEGGIFIESLQLTILETFPVQVIAHISGYLPNSCTEIGQVIVNRDENIFTIEFVPHRESGAFCAQNLKSFEERISLDVEGLPADTYLVMTDAEHTTSFTLNTDNERLESNDAGG